MMDLVHSHGGEIKKNIREIELTVLSDYLEVRKKLRMISNFPCEWLYIL